MSLCHKVQGCHPSSSLVSVALFVYLFGAGDWSYYHIATHDPPAGYGLLVRVEVLGQGACSSGSLPPDPLTFQQELF